MSQARRMIPQSGVIPYRVREGQVEVLVITSSDGLRWVVPKGLVEPGMTAADSAAKEALAKLPKAEQEEWRKLWADVAALLKKVEVTSG